MQRGSYTVLTKRGHRLTYEMDCKLGYRADCAHCEQAEYGRTLTEAKADLILHIAISCHIVQRPAEAILDTRDLIEAKL